MVKTSRFGKPNTTELFCVRKLRSAKQNVRFKNEGDCLDFIVPEIKPEVVIAWATQDDGDHGLEVMPASITFAQKSGKTDPWNPPRRRTLTSKTAFVINPSEELGSVFVFCYVSQEPYRTIFRVGSIDTI